MQGGQTETTEALPITAVLILIAFTIETFIISSVFNGIALLMLR